MRKIAKRIEAVGKYAPEEPQVLQPVSEAERHEHLNARTDFIDEPEFLRKRPARRLYHPVA